MKKLDKDGICVIEHCDECPHRVPDDYNPNRTWCSNIRPGQPVEISVNADFPLICPLENV